MKKVLAVSAFAFLGVIALSSCKKEYSCNCSDSNGNTTVETHKGKDAKDACDSGSSVVQLKACTPV